VFRISDALSRPVSAAPSKGCGCEADFIRNL